MPSLLPLRDHPVLVPSCLKRLQARAHRHLAPAQQDVAEAILPGARGVGPPRVFFVDVKDASPEARHPLGRCFARTVRVAYVPDGADIWGAARGANATDS